MRLSDSMVELKNPTDAHIVLLVVIDALLCSIVSSHNKVVIFDEKSLKKTVRERPTSQGSGFTKMGKLTCK